MVARDLVHIIGATGRSGLALCKALTQLNSPIQPVIRNQNHWKTQDFPTAQKALIADLDGPPSLLAQALEGARSIVSTAHARHIPQILAAGPKDATYIFLGSTRKYTHWPDAHGKGVIAGEKAFLQSNQKGVLLHPTMIYGAEGENNVQRLAQLLKILPIIPLPKKGQSLIQPIYQSDVTKAMIHALSIEWSKPESLVIAGPKAISYADFVHAICRAATLPQRPIISIPPWVLVQLAKLSRFIPVLPTISPAEVQRLMEDKAFDITPMQEKLQFTPISLQEGLAKLYPRERG
ncbi:SDR family oxidoreductase [Entomobacter blattae]|uniref:Uncharacterized protein n=1 Tax=Entomobacter blattae TaxID=2762277 RepID=A0A7H1NT98_9PROT|nr:NmrA family NAD(P)-binding protein [Entomobacter blattae]QNT79008.1 hypothetical protein JGUZn3_17930 [Entomobacter blattae]